MTAEIITYLIAASLVSAALGFMACAILCSQLIRDLEDALDPEKFRQPKP